MGSTATSGAAVLVSINPSNGEKVAEVTIATLEDVDLAVNRAWEAFRLSGWRSLRPDQRATTLYKISQSLLAEKEHLAHLQMADNGKPLNECRGMVDTAAGVFRYYAALIETMETEVTPPRGEYVSLTVVEPFGVVVAITPWNSPLIADAQKVAPALAVGNAVILKPSEESPLLAPELLRICLAAGLPSGQLQVLQGPGETIGAALVANRGVRMISFTGGTNTGRAIARVAGDRLVPVALELGGKSPHIVFADADLDEAAQGVVAGIFSSSGQSCVAGSRMFVERSVYDRVVARVVELANAIIVSNPEDPDVEVGPLVSQRHRKSVAGYVDLARSEGGRVLCGGSFPTDPQLANGAYYMPTVIEGLANTARTVREEIFGPVLVALPFDSEDDLIEQANDSPYGLACGIWTGDFRKAWRVARQIEAGSVWVNTYKQSVISSPFGGFKDSGIGREKAEVGLRAYGETKSIFFGLQQEPIRLARGRRLV